MFESGDNDRIAGRAGEISRYQIRRELWPSGNPLDARVALANAQQIMSSRLAAFERTHGRLGGDANCISLFDDFRKLQDRKQGESLNFGKIWDYAQSISE